MIPVDLPLNCTGWRSITSILIVFRCIQRALTYSVCGVRVAVVTHLNSSTSMNLPCYEWKDKNNKDYLSMIHIYHSDMSDRRPPDAHCTAWVIRSMKSSPPFLPSLNRTTLRHFIPQRKPKTSQANKRTNVRTYLVQTERILMFIHILP